jgi:hypothetical protein
MTNANHDIPGSQIKAPTRLSVEQWDILEIEKEANSTQKPKQNQNRTQKVN